MSIKLFPDKIMIGDFTLSETGDGFQFDGKAEFDTILQTGYFQGDIAGYTAGGLTPTYVNVIDKFPFASDANAIDVGDLSVVRGYAAGVSSDVGGYAAGGIDGSVSVATIDLFYFNSGVTAANFGTIANARYILTGHSSPAFGYVSGGYLGPTGDTNDIEKFPFSGIINAVTSTIVGDLGRVKEHASGHSSAVSGYSTGGYGGFPAGILNVIEKFSFSTDGNATDVGVLNQGRYTAAGLSSDISGYVSGGYTTGPFGVNTIDRFPFATDRNAFDVGDLTLARSIMQGQSSTQSGYTSGGTYTPPAGAITDTIDRFPFATDMNATDVGNLTVARLGATGHQD